jgi:predicted HTH transcriptional regulator
MNVTYDRLAKTLKKDRSTIRRNIQKLKQLDIIKRIGPDKSGHWQIHAKFVRPIQCLN